MQTRGLFITGTDTGVGKTYLTCLIAREMQARGVGVGAYKPVCSNAEASPDGRHLWPDVVSLREAIGGAFPEERICPQKFAAPLAPSVAARLENRTVDAGLLRSGAAWWSGRVELLLVEGVGGLLCPLTETETVADLAADLGLPLLIVARAGLGTINHTLLTVEAARRRGLPVAGIVLNAATGEPDASAQTNRSEIASRTDAPVLGVVPHAASGGLLHNESLIRIDWLELSGPMRGENVHFGAVDGD